MRPWILFVAALLAGCTEPGAPAEPPAPAEEPTIPVEETVDWSVTLGTYACTQTGGISFCGFSGPAATSPTSSADPQPTYLHDADGRDLAGGSLTLEWEPATPTTDALRVSLAAWTGCDGEGDCEELATLGSATGTSPLALVVPAKSFAMDVDEDDDLSIVVRVEPVNFAQGTKVSLGQPVHLTGSLSFIDPMPEWSAGDDEESDEDEEGLPRRG
ncbi:MAG TPA: hypothetical protein VJ874_06850 [Candidatus Thermoplasmatota archaeon]|nr:hypothetical protein [Candidatus Thermoplasmatota archaeon]